MYLVETGYVASRTKAAALIANGSVTVDGVVVKKASEDIKNELEHCVTISSCPETEYVSRGGLKLAAAIDTFKIDVKGMRCIDIGASTGGFTDVLLRKGAKHVTALDSGHGQLHPSLASSDKVLSLEGINARDICPSMFSDTFDIAVMDVSFISQTLILPAIVPILKKGGILISLVKPQFEVGRQNVKKGGIVKDVKVRESALKNVCEFAEKVGFTVKNTMKSPVRGGDGNTEFLVYFSV